MFGRFRKKSSLENETKEDVAATLPELEVEVEAEVVTSGDEIEQARQDLMRAAMEAITIPAPEAESEAAESVPPKSDDADIPVIQVRVTPPAPPIPEPQPKPTAPPQAAEPSAKMEPLAPSEPAESPPSPVEPTIDEQKAPESVEGETATDELPEMVPLRTESLVVKHEPPEIKETTGPESAPETVTEVDPELMKALSQNENLPEEEFLIPEYTQADSAVVEAFPVEQELPLEDNIEEPRFEEQEDIPEDEIIAQIAPENELLSSRLMVFADAENTVAPMESPPAEITLESPASEIPPAHVSFSARPGEQPDEPRIAQLDDIMIDIVKQDIASHRRRISPPN